MIKIEVTGANIGEVADKLLALGANLRGSLIVEGARAAVNAMAAMNPVMPEVAEMVAADPTPAPAAQETASSPSDTATAQPETSATPETSQSTGASAEASGSDTLDFDKDVAPWVLQVVKEKGKPFAQEILSQFGVEKASLLDPARWPELVETLKDAL